MSNMKRRKPAVSGQMHNANSLIARLQELLIANSPVSVLKAIQDTLRKTLSQMKDGEGVPTAWADNPLARTYFTQHWS